MKRLGKLLLAVSLLSGVAYAERVKLFDLGKQKLESTEEGKLETYKIGSVIIKTDLAYNDKKEYYHGRNLKFEFTKPLNNFTLIFKTWMDREHYDKKLNFYDDLGEVYSLRFNASSLYFFKNGKEQEIASIRGNKTFKLTVKNKEINIYVDNQLCGSSSLEHMGSIVSYDQQFMPDADQVLYKFLIIAD